MTAGPAAPASTMSSSSSLTEASSGSSVRLGPVAGTRGEGGVPPGWGSAGAAVAHAGAEEASDGADPQSGPEGPPPDAATPTSSGGDC